MGEPATSTRKESISKISVPRRTKNEKNPIAAYTYNQRRNSPINRVLTKYCCSLSLKLRTPEFRRTIQIQSPQELAFNRDSPRAFPSRTELLYRYRNSTPLAFGNLASTCLHPSTFACVRYSCIAILHISRASMLLRMSVGETLRRRLCGNLVWLAMCYFLLFDLLLLYRIQILMSLTHIPDVDDFDRLNVVSLSRIPFLILDHLGLAEDMGRFCLNFISLDAW